MPSLNLVARPSLSAMGDNDFGRRAQYPFGFVATALQGAIERKQAESTLTTLSAVARWLGYKKGTLHNWISAVSLPKSEGDWKKLTQLPGLGRRDLRRLELLDRLDAWRRNEGLELDELGSLVTVLRRRERDGATPPKESISAL